MQISFTFDTTRPADLQMVVQMLSNLELAPIVEANISVAPAAPEAAPAPTKRGRKAKVQDEPEVAPVEAPEAPVVDENQIDLPLEEAAPAKELTVDDVRGALQAFTTAKGVPAGIELLKKYGAGRISELKSKDYAAFIGECA